MKPGGDAMSAEIIRYWDFVSADDTSLTCPECGWVGSGKGQMELYADLFDVCCPKCGYMIFIILFPTVDETRAAAAAGNQRAVVELRGIEARTQVQRRISETLLRDATELPDLDGDRLVILWDIERVEEDWWTILRHGEREIWREMAYWEGIGRFIEVVEILRARYGLRLVEVRPTPASEASLWGDKKGVDKIVERVNAALNVDDQDPGLSGGQSPAP
jgi:DNA-directed RNA polymerase subunit RPC12/RpoP